VVYFVTCHVGRFPPFDKNMVCGIECVTTPHS
jgi:hypothetical protein